MLATALALTLSIINIHLILSSWFPVTLSDELLLEVAEHSHLEWQRLAENLGITNKEILHIKDHNTSQPECASNMLLKWKDQMSSSKDKLGPLVNSCRKTGLYLVANELEQGKKTNP